MASHDPAGHGAPLPVCRVRARVASGHQQGCGAAGEAIPPRPALGVGRHRVSAPDRGRVAERLGVSWNTTNAAVLAEGRRVHHRR